MDEYKKTTIDSYDKTVDKYIKSVKKLISEDKLSIFTSRLTKGAKILDLGCGPGLHSKRFFDEGYNVTGIDLSEEMIKSAKKKVPDSDFLVMDVTSLDFEDEVFDGIWANAIYLHLKKNEIHTALGEAYRILKKDGIFFVALKQGKGESFDVDKRYGVKKFFAYYGKEELEKILESVGFSIMESNIIVQDCMYATHPWICILCKK